MEWKALLRLSPKGREKSRTEKPPNASRMKWERRRMSAEKVAWWYVAIPRFFPFLQFFRFKYYFLILNELILFE